MIRAGILVAGLALAGIPGGAAADPPTEEPCGAESSLRQAGVECNFSAEDTRDYFGSGDGHTYAIALACDVGGAATCLTGTVCGHTPPGLL